MVGRTDIHRTKIVTTMSRLPASGLDNNSELIHISGVSQKQNSFCDSPFGFESGVWDFIVFVPDFAYLFTFLYAPQGEEAFKN